MPRLERGARIVQWFAERQARDRKVACSSPSTKEVTQVFVAVFLVCDVFRALINSLVYLGYDWTLTTLTPQSSGAV